MKNQLMLFLAINCLLFISCNKDEEGPKYNFKNQTLQGMIDGQVFDYGNGVVSSSDGELSFDLLSNLESTQACDLSGFGDFVSVFFSVPEKEGVVELSFNLQSLDGQTVTLFNPDGSLNIIATEGAIEIVSIDENTVSGRLDIRYDDENFVNGAFTAEFCN